MSSEMYVEKPLSTALSAFETGEYEVILKCLYAAIDKGVLIPHEFIGKIVQKLKQKEHVQAKMLFNAYLLQFPNLLASEGTQKELNATCIPLVNYKNTYPGDVTFIPYQGSTEENFIGSMGIYELKNFYLIGEHALFVNKNGEFLKEQSYHEAPFNTLGHIPHYIRERYNQHAQTYYGSVLSLCSGWANGYFHWMFDCLPKAFLAEECGYTGRYIIPHANNFALETLSLLGIGSERIIPWNSLCAKAETLVVPTHQSASEFYLTPSFQKKFRETLLKAAQKQNLKVPRIERIYLSRKDPHRPRRVVNEKEVMEVLAKKGFRELVAEEYSITEQILIFNQARYLVGPHGAGFVNALFMEKEATIIECFSPAYINLATSPVVTNFNHRYSMIVPPTGTEAYEYGEDVYIHPVSLRATLSDI